MSDTPHSAWYKTYRWQQLRKRHLEGSPLCFMCKAAGRVTAATICDHVEPHRGDLLNFWAGPFQSLCKTHHDSDKQALEKSRDPRMRIGLDGWPIP
jgi:hypothetical protein